MHIHKSKCEYTELSRKENLASLFFGYTNYTYLQTWKESFMKISKYLSVLQKQMCSQSLDVP